MKDNTLVLFAVFVYLEQSFLYYNDDLAMVIQFEFTCIFNFSISRLRMQMEIESACTVGCRWLVI